MKIQRNISKTLPLLALALVLYACSAYSLVGTDSGEQPALEHKFHAATDVLALESKLYTPLEAPVSLAVCEPVEIPFTLTNNSENGL